MYYKQLIEVIQTTNYTDSPRPSQLKCNMLTIKTLNFFKKLDYCNMTLG